MFFTLSKTIGYLAFPLTLSVLAILVGTVLRRVLPKLAGVLLWFGVILLWGASTQPVADFLLVPLESPYEQPEKPGGIRAIVILGGALDLARCTPERLEFGPAGDRFFAALELAREYPEADLVFSGGTGALAPGDSREGSLLRDAAVRFGVERSRILVDDNSRNTRENAVETRKLLPDIKGNEVLLVTSAFHMTRTLACFRKVGLDPVPYAVDFRSHPGLNNPLFFLPQIECLQSTTHAVREYTALVAYRLNRYN